MAESKEPSRATHGRWTARELTYLQQHISDRSWPQLAAHLGRSETAVRLKAKRLGLTKTGSAPGYTRKALADALGVHPSRIDTWRTRGWLHGEKLQTDRTEKQGGDIWRFTRAAVRAFLPRHFNEIDFGRIDPRSFLEITMDMTLSRGTDADEGEVE